MRPLTPAGVSPDRPLNRHGGFVGCALSARRPKSVARRACWPCCSVLPWQHASRYGRPSVAGWLHLAGRAACAAGVGPGGLGREACSLRPSDSTPPPFGRVSGGDALPRYSLVPQLAMGAALSQPLGCSSRAGEASCRAGQPCEMLPSHRAAPHGRRDPSLSRRQATHILTRAVPSWQGAAPRGVRRSRLLAAGPLSHGEAFPLYVSAAFGLAPYTGARGRARDPGEGCPRRVGLATPAGGGPPTPSPSIRAVGSGWAEGGRCGGQ